MRKRLYFFILVCWLTSVFIMLWYPSVYIPRAVQTITFYDKAAHIVFFGVMTYLILAIGIRWGRLRYFWIALLSFCFVTTLNLSGEYVQGFIPGRIPSFLDFMAGVIGTVFAIPITFMIHHSPKQKLLLHVCCAPCATAVREFLNSGYNLEFHFFNPNIYPEKEYQKRLKEVKKLANFFGIKLRIGKYNHEAWKIAIAGHEEEPEGGLRCEACFRYRLMESARIAKDNNLPIFTTTLSVSPHKNTAKINRVGKRIELWQGVEFLEADFKKNNGFQRSLVLSGEFGFYRQKYCGCEFSQAGRKTYPIEN